MKKKYLQLLKRLKERNLTQATIPELNIKLEFENVNEFALMLNDYVVEETLDDIDVTIQSLDKDIVKKALRLIDYKIRNQITTVILIGGQKEEAFNALQSRIDIINNDYVKTLICSDFILINFKAGEEINHFLHKLSSIHVTIVEFCEKLCTVYQEGLPDLFDIHEAPAFECVINALGYFIDEYLMAQILYEIGIIDSECHEILIKNLNSPFVLSLPKHMMLDGFELNRLSNSIWIRKVIEIVKSIPFKRFENYDFDFVEAFLYEQT